MIPILYSYNETSFNSEGLGRLHCLSCTVTEEINGIPECEFTVFNSEPLFKNITLGSIIYCPHDETRQPQPYEIYAVSEPLDGVVTFNARHIVGRLRNIVVEPYTADGVGLALLGLKQHSIGENPFTFVTTKTTIGNFELKVPMTAKDVLGGVRGSILDTYTGEYAFDRFTVTMHNHIGVNSGVEIRYGSNLVSYKHEKDLADTYNAVVPYWKDEETGELVTLPERYIIVGTVAEQYAYLTGDTGEYIQTDGGDLIEAVTNVAWFSPLDLTEYFDSQPTVAELREKAQQYMEDNKPYLPAENFDVDFVQLWQTGEYPHYENLQRVKLGDTVSVYYPACGVSVDSIRVVKTTYDALLERYTSMTLGQKHATFSGALIDRAVDEAIRRRDIIDYDVMQEAIKNATDLLTGELGGNIVFDYDADGKPREMLIMDTGNKETAQNVWRFNASGWGHSSTGINGPYRLAATQDGAIVADFITSGQLNAGLITTGELSADRIKGGTFDGQYIHVINLDATNVSLDGVFQSVQHEPMADETDNTVTIDGGSIVLARSNGLKLAELYAAYRTDSDWNPYPMGGKLVLRDHDGGRFKVELEALQEGGKLVMYGTDEVSTLWVSNTLFHYYPQGYHGTVGIMVDSTGTTVEGWLYCDNDLYVFGSKHRVIQTKDYGKRALDAYETAEPYFGDIGEAIIGENGVVTVPIEPTFAETIKLDDYQVFLQKYGRGDCWVERRDFDSFTVYGTAGLRFGWEIKGKQVDWDGIRMREVKR